jgi:hypothetical protein
VVGADGAVAEAVAEHLEFIVGETLAVEVPVVLAAALSTEITAAAEPRPVGEGGEVRVQVTWT